MTLEYRKQNKFQQNMLKEQDKEQKDIVPYVSIFSSNNSEMFGVLKSSTHILYSDTNMANILKQTKLNQKFKDNHQIKTNI